MVGVAKVQQDGIAGDLPLELARRSLGHDLRFSRPVARSSEPPSWPT
jgi:hypothetical protein